MGFPTPFVDWARGPANEFVTDVMTSGRALDREFIDNAAVLARLQGASAYDRDFWGFFSLELWHQQFHDRAAEIRAMVDTRELVSAPIVE